MYNNMYLWCNLGKTATCRTGQSCRKKQNTVFLIIVTLFFIFINFDKYVTLDVGVGIIETNFNLFQK